MVSESGRYRQIHESTDLIGAIEAARRTGAPGTQEHLTAVQLGPLADYTVHVTGNQGFDQTIVVTEDSPETACVIALARLRSKAHPGEELTATVTHP